VTAIASTPSGLPVMPLTSSSLDSAPSGQAQDLELLYPRGGEVFRTDEIINIKYAFSAAFKKKVKLSDLVELYLLDSNDFVIGFVAEINTTSSEFAWNPQELLHDAGLDTIASPAMPGKYRILLLARHLVPDKTIDGEARRGNTSTIDGDYTQFTNGNVVYTNTPDTETEKNVFATAVSASQFTLVR
jgi:hypothetical protein